MLDNSGGPGAAPFVPSNSNDFTSYQFDMARGAHPQAHHGLPRDDGSITACVVGMSDRLEHFDRYIQQHHQSIADSECEMVHMTLLLTDIHWRAQLSEYLLPGEVIATVDAPPPLPMDTFIEREKKLEKLSMFEGKHSSVQELPAGE